MTTFYRFHNTAACWVAADDDDVAKHIARTMVEPP